MYYIDNRLEESELMSKKALEINTQELMVNNNLAVIYIRFRESDISIFVRWE